MTLNERNEKIKTMVNNGFCTHYAGYICDRNYPEACHKCIEFWMIRESVTKADDKRINYDNL